MRKNARLVTCDHAVTALTKENSFWHSLISFVIFEKKNRHSPGKRFFWDGFETILINGSFL